MNRLGDIEVKEHTGGVVTQEIGRYEVETGANGTKEVRRNRQPSFEIFEYQSLMFHLRPLRNCERRREASVAHRRPAHFRLKAKKNNQISIRQQAPQLTIHVCIYYERERERGGGYLGEKVVEKRDLAIFVGKRVNEKGKRVVESISLSICTWRL